MKYMLVFMLMLIASTAQADEEKDIEYFLGSYSVPVQSGSSIKAPRCAKNNTPSKISISVKTDRSGSLQINEPRFKTARLVSLYLAPRSNSPSLWLTIVYSLPTNENYNLYRIAYITPYADGKTAEIDGLVWGEDDYGELKCWSSFVGTGKFEKQKPLQKLIFYFEKVLKGYSYDGGNQGS
jgi:hypothetical protein